MEQIKKGGAFTDAAIDEIAQELSELSYKVWEFAEVGLLEEKSAQAESQYLAGHGFTIESNVGGMPTAFVAEWGQGKPIFGFLGEFDALAGLSQEVLPHKKPVIPGAPGHGCGHNLLGVGALGAAIALKQYFEEHKLPGTVRYYGCPAEETLCGKVFMARAGVFNDLDAAITWHGGQHNSVQMGSSNGVNSAKFIFHGKTAHAAGDPHNGRSALDAVELMNVGANYLREHVIPAARLHYVITDGGGQPNVVPARAEVWYYVRAPHRSQVVEIYDRLVDIAKGAALMTGTSFEIEFLAGCYDVLPNHAFSNIALEQLKQVGGPVLSPEEAKFAKDIAESFDKKQTEQSLKAMGAPKELFEQVVNTTVIEPQDKGKTMAGSTDVGDVSWNAPTVQIGAACWPIGTPGHSWQVTACSGHSLGVKGMIVATKAMARTAVVLSHDTQALKEIWTEFRERLGGEKYISPVPEGVEPPLEQFK